jgi:ABC-2 type transport system ATP-binding protein
MPVLQVSNVWKSFRDVDLLRDINFQLETGRTYGLVGANGSGKSVLLKIICGFLRPDKGEVSIDAKYLSKGRTFPSDFGVIINGPAYLPNETGLDNLLRLAKIRKIITPDQVAKAMTEVGLNSDSRVHVRKYSLGMKQKLALAQALMENPSVLVLDEPLNALDVESVEHVKSLLRVRQNNGVTVLFTSHVAADVTDLSDVILRIENRSIQSGEPPATV